MKHNSLIDASVVLEKDNLIKCTNDKGVTVKHFFVGDNKYNINKGDYFTLTFPDFLNIKRVFKKTFKTFLKKYHQGGPILFIGLGSNLVGDSFGVRVIDKLLKENKTNDFLSNSKVILFSPNNKNGISSFKLIEMIVKTTKPDVIVLLDSLITKNASFLNNTIEINDCGIIFKEELRSNKVIDYHTFNIPVLAVGYITLLGWHDTYLSSIDLEVYLEDVVLLVSSVIKEILP